MSALLLVSCSKDDDGGTRPPLRSSAPRTADTLRFKVQGGDEWHDTDIKLGEANESEVY